MDPIVRARAFLAIVVRNPLKRLLLLLLPLVTLDEPGSRATTRLPGGRQEEAP